MTANVFAEDLQTCIGFGNEWTYIKADRYEKGKKSPA